MDLFSLPRLGVVVPPENPTAEPEFHRLVGGALNVYASRFPVTPGLGLRDMLERYNTVLADTLAGFGGMRLDAAVVACSASHYLLAPAGDRAFCERLSERAGFPVRSSTQAVLAACEAFGADGLTLVSPYEPWLTDTSRDFWRRAGLSVDEVVLVPAGDRFDPYAVTRAEILERLYGRPLPGDGALLFTGTGMATLAALETLARDTDRLLLTSNLASAWWALREVGAWNPGTAAAHPLLARLAQVPETA
ncbi:arylmalonate decarboxylase [Streptomyces uncialis]|uniref:maleate cis-trans isomerase family protein n=1 Tax=Streptomyces uncialis TaxID=1048205 RepID=UPI0038256E6E